MSDTEPTVEIYRCLPLSTAHLKPETLEDLIERGNLPDSQICGPTILYTKDGGANGLFVKVDTTLVKCNDESACLDGLSDDFRACIEFAVALDCSIIEFDGDAPEVTDLPTYEWE